MEERTRAVLCSFRGSSSGGTPQRYLPTIHPPLRALSVGTCTYTCSEATCFTASLIS